MDITNKITLSLFLKQINKINPENQEKYILRTQKTFYDVFIQKINKIKTQNKQKSQNNQIVFTKSYLGEHIENKNSIYEMKLSCIIINQAIQLIIQIQESQQQQIKKLQELDQFKDSLLASVVHDLRNPLCSITYLLDECHKHADFDKIHEDLSIAKVNSKLLMMLINDILDYCQNKSNKMKYCIEEFDLNELLEETIKLMNIQANLKKLTLILHKTIPQQCQCLTDRRRLQQVLINLLGNSIKFTNFGIVKLVVYISPANILNFEIYDSGSGISKSVQNQLGEPFITCGTSTNNNNNGVGLGLNISKSIIKFLGPGDSFFVSSKINKGSKFSFQIYQRYRRNSQRIEINNDQQDQNKQQFSEYTTLNVCCEFTSENAIPTLENISDQYLNSNYLQMKQKQKAQTKPSKFKFLSTIQEAATPNLEKSELLPVSRQTILIVDDGAFLNQAIKCQLLKINENYNIIEASNGQEALQKFQEHNKVLNDNNNIRLIIMDLQMPVMNGFEAATEIKKCIDQENYIKTSIVGMSGFVTNIEQEQASQAGMVDIFLKPGTFDILQEITFKYI